MFEFHYFSCKGKTGLLPAPFCYLVNMFDFSDSDFSRRFFSDGMAYRIGENVRSARKSKGFSQTSLAKMVGVSHVTISRIENGRISCSMKTYLKIARVLDLVMWVEFITIGESVKRYENRS